MAVEGITMSTGIESDTPLVVAGSSKMARGNSGEINCRSGHPYIRRWDGRHGDTEFAGGPLQGAEASAS